MPAPRRFAKLLLLALAYFACARLGLTLHAPDSNISLFWLPTGIAVAALLRWGPTYWPGIFLGALLTELSLGLPLPFMIGQASVKVIAPLATVWLLRHWRFDASFARQRDLLALLAAAASGMLISASLGTVLLLLSGLLQTTDAPNTWLNWWLGDSVGVLLAGPLLLNISRSSLGHLADRPVESLVCGLLLGISGWLVYFADYGDRSLPLAFLPLPILLWAALRRGVTGTALATLLLSLLAAIGTARGSGVFGSHPPDVAMYLAWAYMFTVVLIGLMVTTILGERQKIEASLRLANDLLRETQAVAKTGSWRIDPESQALLWSDQSYRIFGIPPGTPMDYPSFLESVHPDDRAQVDAAWQAALKGRPYCIQHRIIVNGETRWIEERAQLDIDPNGILRSATGSAQDITDSKLSEQRAAQSELRYKTLVQHAADALFVHDFSGNFLEVNQQACDSTGYTREELLQMNVADTAPRFVLAKAQALWSQLKFGEPRAFTSIKRRKDGSTFPADIRLALLEIDGQKLVMSLVTDITDRVEQEEKLRDTLHQLEEKELSRSRFLAAAGHDLRQPVAAANLFLDMLKLTVPSRQQSELIERLDQSMKIFSNQLTRLLDISRFDAGLIKPEIRAIDLTGVFDWLEQNFAQPALDKQLRFKFHFPLNRPLIVRADRDLLEAVLMSLVSNAIKFTAHGGILISARQRGDRVLLQVWDTGIGIAEADLPHIFDEFFQVSNPQRNRNAGLGLGLSIGQRAVGLLDSKIVCRSHPGRGSVFEFSLPLSDDTPETERPQTQTLPTVPADRSLFDGKNVVVLEDDELVSYAQTSLLRGLNARVLHFHNAEDALQQQATLEADYYIVDYSLGTGLTGYEFLQALQQRRQPPIRAVILTGETPSRLAAHIPEGSWPILHKPANLNQIISSLGAPLPVDGDQTGPIPS